MEFVIVISASREPNAKLNVRSQKYKFENEGAALIFFLSTDLDIGLGFLLD